MSRLIKNNDNTGLSEKKRSIELKPIFTPEEKGEETKNNEASGSGTGIEHERQQIQQEWQQVQEAKRQATEELEQTRKQISEEEEDSKQRIEQAFADAKENGYQEGLEEGKKEGRASYEEGLQEVQNIISSAKQEHYYYIEKAEPVILNLALAVANRIIYESLEDEDGTWLEIVKNAIKEVKDHEEVTIYVPVSRYEETKQQRQELENVLAYSQELVIFPDNMLEESDCVIETPYGKVDASLDSQLNELKEQLEERLKEGNIDESS
ncbi:flagellar assembly protein FliH [Salibacterium salarium]|uniref:flagellar assembly protein FliH n=1 Tax=Salibacterium salarium TaxID=284579 RepID=UPI00163ABF85|nr:flagellar assembly protein FliH [Salibacterium salarium]